MLAELLGNHQELLEHLLRRGYPPVQYPDMTGCIVPTNAQDRSRTIALQRAELD